MNNIKLKFVIYLICSALFTSHSYSKEPLRYALSTNFYKDLSDTYGNAGILFSGELTASKNLFGVNLSYGLFQSQSTFKFKILIEELNETFEIPIEEMAIMKTVSISTFLRPIQKEWIQVDLLFGIVFGNAKNSRFKSVDYTYSLSVGKITDLSRDYQLIKKNHFGYQAGFNISVFPTKKIGFQINSRMQDLSNGGTFFLIGGGICLRL